MQFKNFKPETQRALVLALHSVALRTSVHNLGTHVKLTFLPAQKVWHTHYHDCGSSIWPSGMWKHYKQYPYVSAGNSGGFPDNLPDKSCVIRGML